MTVLSLASQKDATRYPTGGKATVHWTCAQPVPPNDHFGVWLIEVESQAWHGGWMFPADGSDEYREEIALTGIPAGKTYCVAVYHNNGIDWDYGGSAWSAYNVAIYDFAAISIDPASGPAGTLATITGSGFDDAMEAVFFGGTPVGPRFSVIDPTQLVARVPAGAGTVDVYLRDRGSDRLGPSFTYDPAQGPPGGGGGSAPTVASVAPSAASDSGGGGGVTVTGSGFTTTQRVQFGASDGSPQAAFTVVSDTELSVIAPAGSGLVDIIVVNSFGQNAAGITDQFTYPEVSVPVVSSITPVCGYVNAKVTITGSGFEEGCAVHFGTEPAAFTIESETVIVAQAPDLAGAVHVTVSNAGGPSAETANDLFTYGADALPRTTAAGVQPNGYDGWAQGNVTVALAASANGGYGIASTYYALDNGGLVKYAGPFVVSGAGSHLIRWWSIDVQGNVEPAQSGYVNILSASQVPAGLSAVPVGLNQILVSWTPLVTSTPVTYRVYTGATSSPATLVEGTNASVIVVGQPAGDGPRYFAVSSVDVAGTESAKGAAVGPVTALGVSTFDIDDGAVDATKLTAGITASIASAQAKANEAFADASDASTTAAAAQAAAAAAEAAATAADATADTAQSAAASAAAAAAMADGKAVTAKSAADAAASAASTADVNAAAAAGLAAAKAVVLYQTSVPGSTYQNANTLWIDTTASANTPKRWSGSAWVAVTDKTATDAAATAASANTAAGNAASAAATAAAAASTADGKAVTAQAAASAAGAAAATADGKAVTAQAAAVAAAAAAATADGKAVTAQTTADGKNKVIFSTAAASGTTYASGDVWFQKSGSLIIAQWEFVAGAWASRALDNAVIGNLNAGKITAGYIDVARIDAGTIKAVKLDVADVQAAVVTAAKVNALAIDAGAITAGTINTARLNTAEIQAAVVTATAVNALALNAGSITAGTIATARLDTDAIQAAVVTAAAVNALALNASVITAGTISTSRLDTAAIQAAVVTAAKINSLTLNAVSITGGTIQAATFRTAVSGKRVELDAGAQDRINFYPKDATSPAYIYVVTDSGSSVYAGGALYINSPAGTGAQSGIVLFGEQTKGGLMQLNAGSTRIELNTPEVRVSSALTVGSGLTVSAGGITVTGTVNCSGRVNSTTDYPGTGTGWNSTDGIWIQDNQTVANRWKLTYNSTSRVLSLSRGTSRHTSAAFTVAS